MEAGSIETILKHWTGVTVLIIFCVACLRTEFRVLGKYIGGLITCMAIYRALFSPLPFSAGLFIIGFAILLSCYLGWNMSPKSNSH